MLMRLSRFRYAIFIAVAPVCLSLGTPTPVFAQLSDEELRRERVETIEQLKSTEQVFGSSTRMGSDLFDKYGWIMEYGGVASITYTGGTNNDRFEDPDTGLDSTDHNYDYELNLFGSISDQARNTKLYVRLKTKYTEQKRAGTAGSTRGNNYDQANFDLTYFEKKISGKIFQQTWTAGRQYISVGRGIAYAMVADGVGFNLRNPKGLLESYEIFAVRELARDDNADVYTATNIPDAGHTHRQFVGTEVKIRVAPRHKFTFYYVANDDKNTESNPIAGRHQYDSRFTGYGLDGPIPFVPGLTYFGEYVNVHGKSFGRRATNLVTPRDNVKSFAFDMGLKYKVAKNKYTPSVYFQYSAASGDPDRVTAAVGSTAVGGVGGAGNTIGTTNQAFHSCGGLSLGYALAPTFTNIRVYQLGGSIKPWKDTRLLNNATLNLAFYTYRKDISSGVMSDPFVTEGAPRDNLGSEWNASVRWKILSDFKSDFRIGFFSPGEVYGPTRSSEKYIKYKFSVDL